MSTALTRLREAMALTPDNPGDHFRNGDHLRKNGNEGEGTGAVAADRGHGRERRNLLLGSGCEVEKRGVRAEAESRTGTSPKDPEGFQPGSVLALVDIAKVDSKDAPEQKIHSQDPAKTAQRYKESTRQTTW